MNIKLFKKLKNIFKTDINNIDPSYLDNDSLLDALEEVGSIHVNLTIECTQRSNNMKLTDDQVTRMLHIILNQTCHAYDVIGISKDQMITGVDAINNIIYDPNR